MRRRIVVVGAGLSGLACAFDLTRAGCEVLVFEREGRAGGAVLTLRSGPFTFETGPNTVLASSRAFARLVVDLGLGARLIRTGGSSSTRWLWFHGRLVALPTSPPGLVRTPLLSARAKLRIATEPLRRFVPPDDDREPTFEEFLTERLGRETTRLLAGSFVRGVYAAEIEELGARSAFPRMWNAAVASGGLVRGLVFGRKNEEEGSAGERAARSGLVSFPDGLSELVGALTRTLGSSLRLGTGVERLERHGDGWIVSTSDGLGTFADHVVLATQAPAAARFLDPLVGPTTLHAVRHARITVVVLGFERGVLLPSGFGYLVPPDASARGSIAPRALGTIFVSNLFPGRAPEGAATIASFYRTDDLGTADDAAVVDVASADLALALGGAPVPPPTMSHVQRWSDVIPRLSPGHDRRVRALVSDLAARAPALHLAGSYVGGVSVDAVVATGRAVAREVLRQEHLA